MLSFIVDYNLDLFHHVTRIIELFYHVLERTVKIKLFNCFLLVINKYQCCQTFPMYLLKINNFFVELECFWICHLKLYTLYSQTATDNRINVFSYSVGCIFYLDYKHVTVGYKVQCRFTREQEMVERIWSQRK